MAPTTQEPTAKDQTKDKLEEIKDQTTEVAKEAADKAKAAGEVMADGAKDFGDKVDEKQAENSASPSIVDQIGQGLNDAKEKIGNVFSGDDKSGDDKSGDDKK
jgi:hypothetical protein